MRALEAPILAVAVALALATAGCHSTAVEVVQSQATTDLACPQGKIQVKPAGEKGTYQADGCGKKATYVCGGWDSYNQAPVCQPQ
jgi:ferric-dicitrate binding protein FerR (iron transport regulator)